METDQVTILKESNRQLQETTHAFLRCPEDLEEYLNNNKNQTQNYITILRANTRSNQI